MLIILNMLESSKMEELYGIIELMVQIIINIIVFA